MEKIRNLYHRKSTSLNNKGCIDDLGVGQTCNTDQLVTNSPFGSLKLPATKVKPAIKIGHKRSFSSPDGLPSSSVTGSNNIRRQSVVLPWPRQRSVKSPLLSSSKPLFPSRNEQSPKKKVTFAPDVLLDRGVSTARATIILTPWQSPISTVTSNNNQHPGKSPFIPILEKDDNYRGIKGFVKHCLNKVKGKHQTNRSKSLSVSKELLETGDYGSLKDPSDEYDNDDNCNCNLDCQDINQNLSALPSSHLSPSQSPDPPTDTTEIYGGDQIDPTSPTQVIIDSYSKRSFDFIPSPTTDQLNSFQKPALLEGKGNINNVANCLRERRNRLETVIKAISKDSDSGSSVFNNVITVINETPLP